MDAFSDLLKQLGPALGTNLHVDPQFCCTLNIQKKLLVTLQPSSDQSRLIIITSCGAIPASEAYRKILFPALLAANSDLSCGSMALSHKSSEIKRIHTLPMTTPTSDIVSTLRDFCKQALLWQTAIESGALPN